MELTQDVIKQLNPKEIYNLLLPVINKIQASYQFFDINNDEYTSIVLAEITKSKTTYRGKSDYSLFIKEKIINRLSSIIKKMFLDEEKAFQLLNNFILKKCDDVCDYKDAIKCFNELEEFIGKYDCFPENDVLSKLIKENKQFNKILEIIFDNQQSETLYSDDIDIFDDKFLLSSLETYCTLNDTDLSELGKENDALYDSSEDLSSSHLYFNEVGKHPLLTREQEKSLAIKVKNGDEIARKILIERNLKLVSYVAKKYVGKGLPFQDIIQEGNLGLMKATEMYDLEKGVRFSTYAFWWIRQSICKAVADKGKNIRLPVHINEKLAVYNKLKYEMENELGRTPTISEIAKKMKMSESLVIMLDTYQYDTVSINLPVEGKERDTSELGDLVLSTNQSPEEIIIKKSLPNEIRKIFKECNLSKREITVLKLRFGLDGREPMTLEEVGIRYNVTRERIRQIESNAISKIRRYKYIEDLAVYTEYPNKSMKNIKEFNGNHIKKVLNGYIENEGVDEDMPRKVQTIYGLLKDYTKEQVDEMLTRLSEEDRELIKIRYGEDLNVVIPTNITEGQKNKFYSTLVPKMKRLLSIYDDITPESRNIQTSTKEKIIIANEEPVPENVKPQEEIKEELVTTPVVLQDQPVKNTTSSNEKMTKEDCIKILELLRTPSFTQMVSTLSVKDAVIISLKLGYIDHKYFSTEAISKFLGIEPAEVIETTKKTLLLYKDRINDFLDDAISIATDKNDELSLTK